MGEFGWPPGVGGAIQSGVPAIIRDSVMDDNAAYYAASAIQLGFGDTDIAGCTIVNSHATTSGSTVSGLGFGVIRIDRSIVAFNSGTGVRCTYLTCTDIYGNSQGPGEWDIDGGGNFSADPLFCDFEGGDFRLLEASPCLPGNHPDGADCGLIGALGVGCGTTPTEDTTWGRIKEHYR